MNRVTAVIDKSLLQEICEQPDDKLDAAFMALLERYILVVPEILVEEVWVNWANPGPNKTPKVVENMIRCLLHLRDAWIAEPLEIAFVELIKRESIELLPKPPQWIMDSFYELRRDNPAVNEWFKERRQLHDEAIRQRLREQSSIIDSKKSACVASEREVFEKFIRPKFLDMLSDPVRKKKLLEGVLGFTFRTRHSGFSQEIDSAFESYSLESFDKYPATLNCMMTAMFYFYAPLCNFILPNGENRKIVGRGFSDQRGNLNDEKYVQSALLCARLATRDEGMRNIMELLRACGLWNGQTVFIDPKKDLADEIPQKLI